MDLNMTHMLEFYVYALFVVLEKIEAKKLSFFVTICAKWKLLGMGLVL